MDTALSPCRRALSRENGPNSPAGSSLALCSTTITVFPGSARAEIAAALTRSELGRGTAGAWRRARGGGPFSLRPLAAPAITRIELPSQQRYCVVVTVAVSLSEPFFPSLSATVPVTLYVRGVCFADVA